MKCPKCKAENPEDQEFCGKCGTKLVSPAVATTQSRETPMEELSTGSTIAGRYKIVEELGKGGMGKVYKAIGEDEIPIPITACFGVSQLAEGQNQDELLYVADMALYKAKEAGRNRVVVGKAELAKSKGQDAVK